MNISEFIFKIKRKIVNKLGYLIFHYPRILKFKLLSDVNIIGKPIIKQPLHIVGGEI